MDLLLYKLIWIFGWVLVVLAVWYVRGSRKQRRLELIHAERMAAIAKGVPLPELPDYDDPARHSLLAGPHARDLNPRWPLGAGAICIMLGTGWCVGLALSGDAYHKQIWPLGFIGIFLGVGLMLHYVLTRGR
jgi:uncharacterized membrane protein YfcA